MAEKPKKEKPEVKIKVDEADVVYQFDGDKAPANCTRCKTSFEIFGGHRIGVGRAQTPAGEQGWKEVICDACDQSDRIHAYKTTGEMSSRLVMEATMADMYWNEYGGDMSRLRDVVRAYYTNQKDVLLEVAAKNKQISQRAREFEEKHWIGDKGLQGFMRRAPGNGQSAETETFKAMMFATAGRVLLTLQDRYPQGNPKSKFGGAHITLIFDETSPECRGGVQSYCATFEEAMGLLNAAYDNFPTLERDDEVSVI